MGRYGQCNPDYSAPRAGVVNVDGSTMVLNDAIADGKAKSRSLANQFGGKKGVEDFIHIFRYDSAATVLDIHLDHLFVFCRPLRLD